MKDDLVISENVQALIDKIHKNGVVKGQNESKKIVDDADNRAQWIIQQAQEQADVILQKAREEASFIEKSAQSALQLAARDLLFDVKEQLQDQLGQTLQDLISQQLANREFMLTLLQEAIQNQWFNSDDVSILLPQKILDISQISELDNASTSDPLLPAVKRILKLAIDRGVTLTNHHSNGITIKLRSEKVEISTDEHTLTQWLLQFVHPRFRALIDGVIR